MSYFPPKTTERGFGDGIGAGIGVRAGLGQRSGSCSALSCFISPIFEISQKIPQAGERRRSVRVGLQGSPTHTPRHPPWGRTVATPRDPTGPSPAPGALSATAPLRWVAGEDFAPQGSATLSTAARGG